MKKLLSRTWELFSSNVFAVVLIGILAAVSLLGTAIPQKESPEVYLKLFGEVFYRLFSALSLTNLYASPFFYTILALLGLSLFACSYNRLMKLIQKGKSDLYHWGSFMSHLSVLMIYIGVVYGAAAGFSGYAQIEKGKDFSPHDWPFSVHLNDFNAKFDAQGRPLHFSSDLSVMENGREVLRKTISVNDPLVYKGIKFYQSSYGLTGLLEIRGPGGKAERSPISKNACCVYYTPTGQKFHLVEIFPDLHVLHGMSMEVYEPTMPLVLLENIGWLATGQVLRSGEYTLKLLGATEYTGLQVKKDPGVWVVYLGFLLLTAGVGMMLYVKH
jgi:cytochrome c biogenesis protein